MLLALGRFDELRELSAMCSANRTPAAIGRSGSASSSGETIEARFARRHRLLAVAGAREISPRFQRRSILRKTRHSMRKTRRRVTRRFKSCGAGARAHRTPLFRDASRGLWSATGTTHAARDASMRKSFCSPGRSLSITELSSRSPAPICFWSDGPGGEFSRASGAVAGGLPAPLDRRRRAWRGSAFFQSDDRVDYLLHPRDAATGVSYRLLPMIHAIIAGLFTPEQARGTSRFDRAVICSTPDGARLFDWPMEYHGGPQNIFAAG